MHVQKTENSDLQLSMGSSIDKGPYVSIAEDGMVAAVGNEHAGNNVVEHLDGLGKIHEKECDKMVSSVEQNQHTKEAKSNVATSAAAQVSGQSSNLQGVKSFDVIAPVKRWLNHVSRQNRKSIGLLAYIAIMAISRFSSPHFFPGRSSEMFHLQLHKEGCHLSHVIESTRSLFRLCFYSYIES